jgi:hypothetical protein
MLLLLASAALAGTPERVAAELPASGSLMEGLVVLPDLELAATLDGAGSAVEVVDLQSWDVITAAVCPDAVPAGITGLDQGTTAVFYVGCDDGTVDTVLVDEQRAVQAGDPIVFVDGVQVLHPAVGVDDASGDRLWAILDGVDNLEAHYIDLDDASETVTQSGSFSQSGIEVVREAPGFVFLVHGTSRISKLQSSTGSISVTVENLSGSWNDMAFYGSQTTGVVADGSGRLVQYQPNSVDEYQILVSDLDAPSALGFSLETNEDAWLAVADGDAIGFFNYVPATNGLDAEPYSVLELTDYPDADVLEVAAATESHLLLLTNSDELLVLADVPWVELTADDTTGLGAGDTVTLTLSADADATYRLTSGTQTGELLASGDLEADTPIDVEIQVGDDWEEGANRVHAVVLSGSLTGWDALDLEVDTPPPAPEVTLGFGDGVIDVTLSTADDVEDLASYEIYLSTTAFEASDFDEGGPEFDGEADVTNPISVTPESPTASVVHTIEGLTNGNTYYLGVRVVDEAGTEGDMSTVQSIQVQPAVGAAGLAGDAGGFCGTSLAGSAGVLGLLGLAVAALRRRRGGLVALLALAMPVAANADEGEPESTERHPAWEHKDNSVLVRVGVSDMDQGNADSNAAWKSVYGGRIGGLHATASRQYFRFFSFDAGLGVQRKDGTGYSSDGGTASTGGTKMTVLPLNAGVTLRLDPFLPRPGGTWINMPLVPYVSAGLDYWVYSERLGGVDVEDLFANSRTSGGKIGWHYAVGGELLLDWMQPERASKSEARWGIVNTYLVVDWRRTAQFNDTAGSDLSFASDTLTVGVKVDRK